MQLRNLKKPMCLELQDKNRGLHYEAGEIGRGHIFQGLIVRIKDFIIILRE